VDGFIFGRVEHLAEVEPARLRRLPFAVVDFDLARVSARSAWARTRGCYAAAKHLIEHGHRRFGILSFLRSSGSPRVHPAGQRRSPGAAGLPTDQEKFQGFADALSDAGLDINDVPMVQADPWDRDAAPMMLDAGPDATAILSMSMMQAIAVINEARRRGLSVPRDLSVVDTTIFRTLSAPIRHLARSTDWESKKGAPLRGLFSRADHRGTKY
jgi:DNA-binding LacI/PurR family transcriptional regulator